MSRTLYVKVGLTIDEPPSDDLLSIERADELLDWLCGADDSGLPAWVESFDSCDPVEAP